MKTTRTLWSAFSKPAAPISRVEFSRALAKIWIPSLHSKGAGEATIGLAISGGVDSMALAVLCSQLQQYVPNLSNGLDEKKYQDRILPELRFQAFVVDHDVRAGSDLEAKAVSEVLEKRGIPTSVLKIRWPRNFDPTEKQGFESLARKYRFRILGKACRDLRINSLLLAHHEDDQAETVLMRMLSGHRLAGLTGIRERSEIPENHGVYGVHESGGSLLDVENITSTENATSPKHQLKYEDGGIQLYRPMLGFSKARLIATCKSEEMTWFEDQTNKDPSLTARNAIRHLFTNHKLPMALSKSALLNLSASAIERIAIRKAAVDRWLSSDKIRNFETRSGTMVIRFPHIKRLKNFEKLSMSEKKQMAAELLRRVLMLITPEENIEVSSLHRAVARLFPETGTENEPIEDDTNVSHTGFTIAGVQFQPHMSVLEDQEELVGPAGTQVRQKPEWFLSRQPLNSASSRPSSPKTNQTQEFSKPGTITKFGSKTAPADIDGKIAWSPIFEQFRISEPASTELLLPASSEHIKTDASQISKPTVGISHLESAAISVEPSELDKDQMKLQISQYRTPKQTLSASTAAEAISASLNTPLNCEATKNPRNIYIAPASTDSWSLWSLFDNRYWVRVLNPTSHPLHVKHFTRAHLTSFKHTLSKPYRRYVQDLLKKVAPGNIRWTLPVLVKVERAWGWESGEWRDEVVALPTLGVSAFHKVEDASGEVAEDGTGELRGLESIRWEVRYKKINLEGIPMSKDLLPSSAYATALDLSRSNLAKNAQPKCLVCGSPSHTEALCWTAYPELKPIPKEASTISTIEKVNSGLDDIQGEEPPGSPSSTKKKILKRLAWLKVRRIAIKKSRLEKVEKRKQKGGEKLDMGGKGINTSVVS